MNLFTGVLAILLSVVFTAAENAREPAVLLFDGDSAEPISVEEYVARAVAHEMPHTFNKEALRAQAVAARTYMYYCIENGSHPHEKGDVCTDVTHCMGYITEEELAARYGDACALAAMTAARQAADSTRGEVLLYGGEPILSVWHSSSDGYTEDSGNVWLCSLPYLVPVKTGEKLGATVTEYTFSEVRELLYSNGFDYDMTPDVWQRGTDTGRCAEVHFGNVMLSGSDARRIFGLRSTDFTVCRRGDVFVITSYGYGHGVGMSQYGAEAMAESGSGYREILTHYYSGAVIGQWGR